jgi:hypothetical protein
VGRAGQADRRRAAARVTTPPRRLQPACRSATLSVFRRPTELMPGRPAARDRRRPPKSAIGVNAPRSLLPDRSNRSGTIAAHHRGGGGAADAAASAIAAYAPRRGKIVPGGAISLPSMGHTSMGHLMGHLEAVMITDINQGLRAVSAKPLVRAAEARGFEPRMGANPNRISSPFAAAKATISRRCPPQSAQVSGVVPGKATEAAAVRRNASWAISGPSQTLLQPGPPGFPIPRHRSR